MLAGRTRIKLLRELHARPGQNIAALADALCISRPYASQEMRRIQSRGFLRPTHRGVSLVYEPVPDPQVSTAAPLLKAVQTALASFPPRRDDEMIVIAAGLAHERRIALARTLLHSLMTPGQLLAAVPMAPCSFQLHLRVLRASGFLAKDKQKLSFQTPTHPLGKALGALLRQGVVK